VTSKVHRASKQGQSEAVLILCFHAIHNFQMQFNLSQCIYVHTRNGNRHYVGQSDKVMHHSMDCFRKTLHLSSDAMQTLIPMQNPRDVHTKNGNDNYRAIRKGYVEKLHNNIRK
jgi:hypothetical protein